MALSKLINYIEERLNLNCYTVWERKFLTSAVQQFKRTGTLSERQEAKVREVIRVRCIIGEEPHIDSTGKPTGKPFPKERLDRDYPILHHLNVTCQQCGCEVPRITVRQNSSQCFERVCRVCGAMTTFHLDEQRLRITKTIITYAQGEMYGTR